MTIGINALSGYFASYENVECFPVALFNVIRHLKMINGEINPGDTIDISDMHDRWLQYLNSGAGFNTFDLVSKVEFFTDNNYFGRIYVPKNQMKDIEGKYRKYVGEDPYIKTPMIYITMLSKTFDSITKNIVTAEGQHHALAYLKDDEDGKFFVNFDGMPYYFTEKTQPYPITGIEILALK